MENDMGIQKLAAEIRHLNAMSDKLMADTRWYPMVVCTALATALMALGAAIGKFIF